MEETLTREQICQWLLSEEDEFYIDKFRAKHQINPDSSTLYVTFGRLCDERKLKKLGRGLYRQVKFIKPIDWRDTDEEAYFDLAYPYGHEDNSSFGFEDLINLSAGDLIVVSGVSNTGKSTFVLNILGENVARHKCILMGNEYATLGGKPSPKFKRRMMKMSWVNWNDGSSPFVLLPIREHFEDYIEPGAINIMDWINLTDQFYKIGQIFEDIKVGVGDGIAVAVLQKEEQAELARGKGFTRDLADVYFTIDPFGDWESRLTVGKVKDPKKRVTGRSWAFKIVDGGANLHDIREVVRCNVCYGKKWKRSGNTSIPCDACDRKGFINKGDLV